jgi:hypothetical protein
MREMREKERTELKPLKEHKDNGRSHNLTHLTQVSEGKGSEVGAGPARAPDYLGPPGDDPSDFLGDIPDFLRRA